MTGTQTPPGVAGSPTPAAGDGQGGASEKKIQTRMSEDRLSYLAGHLAPRRAVVSYEETGSWTVLTLECGHTAEIAAHFDPRHSKTSSCRACGRAAVLVSPLYAEEFSS